MKIETLGYKVKRNIGYSEYKMDIGVVNPHNKQTYVLGILLDGKNCKNSATAKDSIVLQPDIFTRFGYSRTGTLIDATVRNAVMLGQQNNILKISDGNKVSLC
ncbi:MAG: hypothetical protein LKJ92_00455 [Ruminococcus sp.]|nr:hypothetical protein [Ruminococcus sp.]